MAMERRGQVQEVFKKSDGQTLKMKKIQGTKEKNAYGRLR